MLFDYIYLLDNVDFDFSKDSDRQKAEFIIPIDDKVISQDKAIFEKLTTTENHFCFYFPSQLARLDDSDFKEKVFRNIVRIIFLPNYLKINERFLFFVEEDDQQADRIQNLKKLFIAEMIKQGISNPILEGFNLNTKYSSPLPQESISLTNRSLIEFLETTNNASGFDEFIQGFKLPENFDKKWIIPLHKNSDYERKVAQLEQFEKSLAEATEPFKMQLVSQFKSSEKERSTLQTEYDTIKFKLENSTLSLKLIREEAIGYVIEVDNLRREVDRLASQINNPGAPPPSSSVSAEAEEIISQLRSQTIAEHNRGDQILAWYKKEYEVLPLWYKKFGHVIKVLTGKRTFKSLFK